MKLAQVARNQRKGKIERASEDIEKKKNENHPTNDIWLSIA